MEAHFFDFSFFGMRERRRGKLGKALGRDEAGDGGIAVGSGRTFKRGKPLENWITCGYLLRGPQVRPRQ